MKKITKFSTLLLINFAFCLITLPILERLIVFITNNHYIFNSSLHLINSFNWALLFCIAEIALIRKKAVN